MSKLTHLDESGRLAMVEVGGKAETRREAEAACRVRVGPRVFPLVAGGSLPKGDVFAAARLAGIMAAKNTAQLIPLCHPLPLTGVEVDFDLDAEGYAINVTSRVRTFARTGLLLKTRGGSGTVGVCPDFFKKSLNASMLYMIS